MLAGDVLFAAGTPDTTCADDPWAAIDGRRGGVLRATAVEDRRELSVLTLDSPPVYDGMAAAEGKLYISASDGTLRCYSGKREADRSSRQQ